MTYEEAIRPALQELAAELPQYRQEAYAWVLLALKRAAERSGRMRHVRPEEILWALRDAAQQECGLMAMAVMEHVGIRSGRDVGRLVFALAGKGVLVLSPEDRLAGFDGLFDSLEWISRGYQIRAAHLVPGRGARRGQPPLTA